MILFNKKGLLAIGASVIFFVTAAIIYSNVYEIQGHYMINILSKYFFEFLLAPIFLILSSLIDKSVSFTVITRLESRKKTAYFELLQQYLLAFILICAHGTALIIVSLCQYGFSTGIQTLFVLKKLILFFLGLLISANLSYILKRCNINNVSSASFVFVYIFLVTEMSLIGKLNNYVFDFDIFIVFSWILRTRGYVSIIVMSIEFILSTIVVLKLSSKSDIL